MSAIPDQLRDKPLIERCMTVGTPLGFVLGGIGGLTRGLEVRPATAWFAVFELGIPAAIVGGLVGLMGGLTVIAGRRLKRRRTPPVA
ncbi:MAG: hypothetical protein ACLP0J_25345 [Solirubrobacteraceae bacterium]